MKSLLALLILLALSSPALAGMLFNDASSEYALKSNPAIQGVEPMTWSCKFRSDDVTISGAIMAMSGSANDNFTWMLAEGTFSGDPVRIQISAFGNNAQIRTGTFAVNTWHSSQMVWASTTDLRGFVDGANKGTSATSVDPALFDILSIGVEQSGTLFNHFSGDIAECALWNRVLSDAEVAMMDDFFPNCRLQGLTNYYPMIGDTTSLKDRATAADDLTLTGGTIGEHPPGVNCQ